jgi:hypothetical protein
LQALPSKFRCFCSTLHPPLFANRRRAFAGLRRSPFSGTSPPVLAAPRLKPLLIHHRPGPAYSRLPTAFISPPSQSHLVIGIASPCATRRVCLALSANNFAAECCAGNTPLVSALITLLGLSSPHLTCPSPPARRWAACSRLPRPDLRRSLVSSPPRIPRPPSSAPSSVPHGPTVRSGFRPSSPSLSLLSRSFPVLLGWMLAAITPLARIVLGARLPCRSVAGLQRPLHTLVP